MNHKLSKAEIKLIKKINEDPLIHEEFIKQINDYNKFTTEKENNLNHGEKTNLNNIATNTAIAASLGMVASTLVPGSFIIPAAAGLVGFFGNHLIHKKTNENQS